MLYARMHVCMYVQYVCMYAYMHLFMHAYLYAYAHVMYLYRCVEFEQSKPPSLKCKPRRQHAKTKAKHNQAEQHLFPALSERVGSGMKNKGLWCT